jgi:hypothetical protein
MPASQNPDPETAEQARLSILALLKRSVEMGHKRLSLVRLHQAAKELHRRAVMQKVNG